MAEDGHFHGGFPSNLGKDNNAQEMQPAEALRAYDEKHSGSASSTKLIPKANADNMKDIDMDDSLKSMPVPKKNQSPKIPSCLKDTQGFPSRDEGRRVHDPRTSNYAQDDNTQTGESLTNRSTAVARGITSPRAAALAKGTAPKTKSLGKAIQDDITSPRAAELAKVTAAASSSTKSVILVAPKTVENVNSLGGPSALMPSPTKAVQDAPDRAEDTLAVGRPPTSSTESLGKAIEANDQEHGGAETSTKTIPKANAEAGPSVRAPAQHQDGVVAAIGGPVHPNASDVASNVAPAIPAFPQLDANVVNHAIGGGAAGVGPAAGHPNAARQVPAPVQIKGGSIAVVVALPAPAAAIPVLPVLPPNPNPGDNYIDEVLMNSGIRSLRNPADGDEGKIWDTL